MPKSYSLSYFNHLHLKFCYLYTYLHHLSAPGSFDNKLILQHDSTFNNAEL